MKTRQLLTKNWYLEWSLLSHHEQTLLHVGLQLPTPKDHTFFLSFSILTLSVFWFEIHHRQSVLDLDEYQQNLMWKYPDALSKWKHKGSK